MSLPQFLRSCIQKWKQVIPRQKKAQKYWNIGRKAHSETAQNHCGYSL